jgi:acyl-CoA synthetase (AMP-forming)/AMP-acid ligase II
VSTEASDAPLCATLEEACRRWASRPAITFDETTITYEALWKQVDSLAAAYEGLGIHRGDRVLCQLRNGPEHVIATAAAWMRGAIHVGADNDLTGPELARLVERLDARALVFQPPRDRADDPAALREAADAAGQAHLIVHGAHPEGHHSMAGLLASGGTVPAGLPGPLDPAHVFLTSGTTAEPKAVVETLSAHWAKMQFFADGFLPGPEDVHLLFLPIAHVFGSRLALLALLRGGHLVLMDRFSPERALEVLQRERVTVMPAVPTHLRLLRARYDPARHDVSSLRWVLSAAAGLPRPLAEWVYTTLDARMMFVYGCSEGFTTATTEPDDILAGSVGERVFRGPPGTPAEGTVRIVDPEEGTPLPAGETGEIAFRAATPVPYWDHPDPAVDGWYRTGDLGRVDAQGRLYVVGRLKELINRGGLHVSAAEVEMMLVRHPAVADGAVVATPDPVLGEATCACVVPADAHRPDLAELRTFLAADLARHKLPDELCIVGSIPRTDIGKVDRQTLTTQVRDEARVSWRERLA